MITLEDIEAIIEAVKKNPDATWRIQGKMADPKPGKLITLKVMPNDSQKDRRRG
jgi:hypothetical protein